MLVSLPEGWPSGLRRTLGKRVYGKPYRGFESHSLRQASGSPTFVTIRHRRLTCENFTIVCKSCVHCHSPRAAGIRVPFVGYFVDLGGHFSRRTRVRRTHIRSQAAPIEGFADKRQLDDDAKYSKAECAGGDACKQARPLCRWWWTYLRVGRGGAKNWTFRFMLNGRAREMGFGSLTKVGLADARKKANDARRLLSEGCDPLAQRQNEENERAAAAKLAAARSVTFDACAEAYIRAHQVSWRNEKHRQQWTNTLKTYASPVLGSVPIQDIDVELIMRVVEPIWSTKTETARRVRGRIEVILDWAKVRGYRSGDNPARWRGHLNHLLPARSRVRAVKHHAALPHTKIEAFMKDLRKLDGTSAAALEFLILTAARTSEVIGARWTEIDLQAKVWTVPSTRMKSGREHRVPLSSAAIKLLKRMKAASNDFVFPGQTLDYPLSNMALLMLLGRMSHGDITAHGFRSTFRDWAADRANFSREVVEMALAHLIEDKTEAAYRRGDLFEKRRRIMEAWARYCGSRPSGAT